jgi:hypothetical protein
MQPDREALLDEIGRCFARAAVDAFLAESRRENAEDCSQQDPRRRNQPCEQYSPSADQS